MKIYIPKKNNGYRKKSAALPAAALPFTAADRDWNRTAQNFYEILLAIGQSGSAALPLPRVPPFLFYTISIFCIYFSCIIPDAPAVNSKNFRSREDVSEPRAHFVSKIVRVCKTEGADAER